MNHAERDTRRPDSALSACDRELRQLAIRLAAERRAAGITRSRPSWPMREARSSPPRAKVIEPLMAAEAAEAHLRFRDRPGPTPLPGPPG